ncbi:GNAT family N-acetyltransferase [Patescibacteria group bacterium]
MNISFRKAIKEDKQIILLILSNRQDESNEESNKKRNVVLLEGGKVFEEIVESKLSTIIVGQLKEKIVCILTIHLLPQIRSGGYYAVIEDVLVIPEHRSQGVGKKLMKYAINYLRENSTVYKIKLGTRKDSEGLHRFYESCGFVFNERFYKLVLK